MDTPYDNPTATRALISALVEEVERLRPVYEVSHALHAGRAWLQGNPWPMASESAILAAVRPLYANPVDAAMGAADDLEMARLILAAGLGVLAPPPFPRRAGDPGALPPRSPRVN
jgi:hypothetical protein